MRCNASPGLPGNFPFLRWRWMLQRRLETSLRMQCACAGCRRSHWPVLGRWVGRECNAHGCSFGGTRDVPAPRRWSQTPLGRYIGAQRWPQLLALPGEQERSSWFWAAHPHMYQLESSSQVIPLGSLNFWWNGFVCRHVPQDVLIWTWSSVSCNSGLSLLQSIWQLFGFSLELITMQHLCRKWLFTAYSVWDFP